MGLATCSEVFADVASVEHDRCQLCEVLCKYEKDCSICIVHARRAGSKTGKCAGKNKFVSTPLCNLS